MCTSWPALLRPGVACALWLDWSRLLLAMEFCLCTCSFLPLESLYSVFGSSNPWPFYTTEMVYLSTRLSLPLYVCALYLMVISRLGSRWDGGQKGSGIITDNSPDLLLRRTPLNKVTRYCNEVQEITCLPHASWKYHGFWHWLWGVYLALHTHKFNGSE